MKSKFSPFVQLYLAIALSCFVSILLWTLRVISRSTIDYWYLSANLILALVPILPTLLLQKSLAIKKQKQRSLNKKRIYEVFLFGWWLLFLPNSFYIITDYIHTQEAGVSDIFDVIMLGHFSINGFIVGFVTLLTMHKLLKKRFGSKIAARASVLILLLCSYALYLGRDVRLNSWDLIYRPESLALGLFSQLNPLRWPYALKNSLLYLSILAPMYLIVLAIDNFYSRADLTKKVNK
jgi:uncharacterized membrane protein